MGSLVVSSHERWFYEGLHVCRTMTPSSSHWILYLNVQQKYWIPKQPAPIVLCIRVATLWACLL